MGELSEVELALLIEVGKEETSKVKAQQEIDSANRAIKREQARIQRNKDLLKS